MRKRQFRRLIINSIFFLSVFSMLLTPILVLNDPLGLATLDLNADVKCEKLCKPNYSLETDFSTDPYSEDRSGDEFEVDFSINPTIEASLCLPL